MPTSCNAGIKLLPNGGGDLALTLRRSVRERCVCCATQITPRALLFICETELRYALWSKARNAKSTMSTLADKRPIATYTSGPRIPCISLRYCQAAMCMKESKFKLKYSNSYVRSFSSSTSADCSLNPTASLQLTAAIKNPARTESFHADLMQRRDQAPAPPAEGISL